MIVGFKNHNIDFHFPEEYNVPTKLGNIYLNPKNTVVYRDFYNNIGKLTIDKSTQDNFKNLFENLIQKLGIKIDK